MFCRVPPHAQRFADCETFFSSLIRSDAERLMLKALSERISVRLAQSDSVPKQRRNSGNDVPGWNWIRLKIIGGFSWSDAPRLRVK